ncbi:MAG: hypothetical protein QCI82_05285 [Candidatus Thermoplasmatota archaeon]|nr:hypothetical protein [Candidatus Thermoplasmatota archaeon]
MKVSRSAIDRAMVLAGIVLLGSIWGLLECTLGGLKWSVSGLYISMGAVMAGLFGLGFMILARRMFNFTGAVFLVALVASIMRYFAPIGSCVICSAIAIAVEGMVFEMIVGRKVFMDNLWGRKDVRALASLGVISGFTVFSIGYVTTQILTPVFTGATLVIMDVVNILPLIAGRAFYAALLGGISVPVFALYDNLHVEIQKIDRKVYFGTSTAVSAVCWILVLFILF